MHTAHWNGVTAWFQGEKGVIVLEIIFNTLKLNDI